MTENRYQNLTVDELVIEFGNLCLAQYEADNAEEIARYNFLFKRMTIVENELKARPGDQRRALQVYFGEGNLQLRLMAAHANLTIDYEKSRRELEAIEATEWMPQAANAGMTLESLDTGFYRPT